MFFIEIDENQKISSCIKTYKHIGGGFDVMAIFVGNGHSNQIQILPLERHESVISPVISTL